MNFLGLSTCECVGCIGTEGGGGRSGLVEEQKGGGGGGEEVK